MPIYLGSTNIKGIYVGSTKIKEAYIGEDAVYKSELYIIKDGVIADGFSETEPYSNSSVFPRCASDSGYWGYEQTSTHGTMTTHYRASVYIMADLSGYSNLHVTCEYDSTKTDKNGGISGDVAFIATKTPYTFSAASGAINGLTTNADTICWIGGLDSSAESEQTYTFSTNISEIRALQLAVYAYNRTFSGYNIKIKDVWVD